MTAAMIRLDNISKQHGHQILFIDASMGLQKGEKVGLVGPNGAGKTTIFRMIAGQEQPDDGQVTIDPMDCSSAVPSVPSTGAFTSAALWLLAAACFIGVLARTVGRRFSAPS